MSQRRSGGLESAAGRRALSQQRSGGVISREWRAWGSGNPATRQPAGGLGRATAGGRYLPRSAGKRASRPVDSRHLRRSRRTPTPSCSGLWRDYERRLPCHGTDINKLTGTKQKTFENENKTRWMGAAYGLGLVFCHGAHTREEQEHADEDINSNNSL